MLIPPAYTNVFQMGFLGTLGFGKGVPGVPGSADKMLEIFYIVVDISTELIL